MCADENFQDADCVLNETNLYSKFHTVCSKVSTDFLNQLKLAELFATHKRCFLIL